MNDAPAPDFPSLLRERDARIKAQEGQVGQLTVRLEQAQREIALLRKKMDLFLRRLYGAKSEQIDSQQLVLLLLEAPAPTKPEELSPELRNALAPTPARNKGRRARRAPRVPENLPVIEEVLVPAAVQAAPEQWRRIGEEITDLLDYEPGRFLCRRTVRPKYIKRGEVDAAPVIAPLPDRVLERGIAAPGLLAQILVAKYCDHLPLYRQEYIYQSRFGVDLPRQTMARWVGDAAQWLKPICEAIRTRVMGGNYVQIDETPIPYLAPGHGETKTGYLWACCRPGHDVAFHWHTSRAASCLEKIVPVSFRGDLQCDGYEAYPAFAKRRPDQIRLAGCVAHARRKFVDALEEAPRTIGWILLHYKRLYQVEERLREARAGPDLRQAVRAAESRMIHDRLHKALIRLKAKKRFLPKSLTGEAIDYALNHWPALSVYLSEGRIEIDNNLVENAIRPSALGKKNWLFIGEADAGARGAIIYTLIESCRRRDIDPYEYLRDVLDRLPRTTNWQVKDLTPEAWAKERSQAALKAAA